MRRRIAVPISGWLVVALAVTARADESVQFNRDIRPILSANCFACHGSDAGQRKADLRLDVAASARVDLGGTAVVPGQPDESEMWRRMSSEDPELVMPPPDAKKELTAAQKDLIRRWIAEGGVYQEHWAFETPVAPPLPAVRDEAWIRNPLDRFILARLEQDGLRPQPEADRETLIRRVAFALTGLPPTIAEVDEYLNDTSDDAYDHMVQRYLASPQFGEEQARHWLDLARYADTHGLHLDNERHVWAYRDWVVRAFNENLPFDKFTTWQLAGDLLPEPTLDQLIATGFNRCNVSTSEGGSIEAEWVYRNAVDRTSTMMQTWLGLTGGCAVCHDHKYDPLTSREFYSLYAFFYSAADPGLDGNIRDTRPFLKVPTAEQAATTKELEQRLADARQRLEEALLTADYHDPAQPAAAAGGEAPSASPQDQENPEPAADAPAALHSVQDMLLDDDFPYGARVSNTSRNAAEWPLDPKFGARSGRRVLELASSGEYEVTIQLGAVPLVVPQAGRLEFWWRADPYYRPAVFAIQLDDGKVNRRAVWGDANQLSGGFQHIRLGDVPQAGEWMRLSISLIDVGLQPGQRVKSLVLQQKGGRVWLDALQVAGEFDPALDPRTSFSAWWRALQGTDPGGVPGELNGLLKDGPDQEHPQELPDKLRRFYLHYVQRGAESPVAELRAAWEQAENHKLVFEASIPGTMVFSELATPRETFVMLRGQYDKPGDKVEPAVPAIFPALQGAGGRPTRLDLAKWLMDEKHPLTARVAVNRMWQQIFGTGLVATSDDFGTQGELPSHPQLLDWLATQYRAQGWNTKDLLKLLVTSATFRQNSATTPELLQRDPDNRLLAHGPRIRLDAEQIRDNALFVSGLMNLQMGGRGVFPYQPPNIWEPVGYENSNTRFYMQDHGESLYRRSLYCFLKRTAPPPFMSNFDGPNREQYCALRERTNTPLQALQLMNDVQHFEAARALAERLIAEAGPELDQRLTYLYRTVVSRRPTAAEQSLLVDAYKTQFELFAADGDAAQQTIQFGEKPLASKAPPAELAAWTLIANLVLNLDETLTRN
jgi:hypothetical protein